MIVNPGALESTPKQGMDALIWPPQTRHDIGFAITQIAAQIAEACESPEKARKVAHLCNKIARFVKCHRRKIIYIEFPSPNNSEKMAPPMRLSWERFVFADAGFGTLVQNRRAESHVIVL